MENERRYGEDEVREIFDLATSNDDLKAPVLPGDGGLTLREIQEIGREVGVEPGQITAAATAVAARRTAPPQRTSLRMPISVGRVVPLPRPLTDREWEVMIAELRETFRARGRVASHGTIREWTNGNLHAFVEPTETSHRLRIGTLKSGAMALNRVGMVGLAAGVLAVPLSFLFGADPMTPVIWAGAGAFVLASNFFRQRSWAREREEQMEHITERLGTLVGTMPPEAPDGTG